MREAEANNVLPLNDMQVTGKDLPTFMKLMFQVPVPHSGRYVYYPGTSPIPEKNAANNHAVSFKILAEVVIEAGTQGVIFAQGSRFGGHALYVKDGKVSYVHNFLGIPPMQVLKPRCRLPADTSSESNSPRSDPASTTKPTGRRRCTSTKPLATGQALDEPTLAGLRRAAPRRRPDHRRAVALDERNRQWMARVAGIRAVQL